MNNFYGDLGFQEVKNDIDSYMEEIKLRGFCVINNLLSKEQIVGFKRSIHKIYNNQLAVFGEDKLSKIKDLDMARCLLKYDFKQFKQLVFQPLVIKVVSELINQKFILSLQNAIINRTADHHQGSWHRDLPYQNFVANEIISMNALWALDDFSQENGGTCLLPYSMNFNSMPSKKFSDENLVQPNVSAGSVIIFNSMLLHRAGSNTTNDERIAVNHQYIRPFIQPQYRFNEIKEIQNQDMSSDERDILGFNFISTVDDIEWRNSRYNKIMAGE